MKKIFLIAASAMMVFASCTKVNVNYPDNGQPQEIALFSVNKNMVKAPVTDDKFPDYSMQVAAYLAEADGATPGEYFDGTTFAKPENSNDNDEVWTGGQYWPISNATINFFAVAPQEASACTTTFAALTTGENSVKVATTTVTNNATNQNDVMYALAQGKHTAGGDYDNVEMIFKHALSLITYTDATSEDDDIDINKVTLNNVYFDGTGTFTVPQAKYTSKTETDVVSASVTPAWVATGNVANKEIGTGILVVPNTYEYSDDTDAKHPSLTINYSVGKFTYDYTYTLPKAATNAVAAVPVIWEPGKKYNYAISISLTEIKIEPKVDEWEPYDNDTSTEGNQDIPVAGK